MHFKLTITILCSTNYLVTAYSDVDNKPNAETFKKKILTGILVLDVMR